MLANLFDAFAIYIACVLAIIPAIYAGSVLPDNVAGNALLLAGLTIYVFFFFVIYRGLKLLSSALRR